MAAFLMVCAAPFFTSPAKANHCGQTITQDCVLEDLGIKEIKTENILIKRNPTNFIVLIFRVLLAVAIIVVVYRIVIAGIKIGGAKDDADKRKEQFKQIIFNLFGLFLAFSALALSVVFVNIAGGTVPDQIINCQDLPPNASDKAKQDCGIATQ